ncbi:MAG: hypothetical protein OEZ58_11245 [Gammaproteobacteria bacterium]|nr:hypothetical protein [Gammaproteobacteria bacterium]MDH5729558.1 hypothetical protein [Gammaproteobacteria bacterium]
MRKGQVLAAIAGAMTMAAGSAAMAAGHLGNNFNPNVPTDGFFHPSFEDPTFVTGSTTELAMPTLCSTANVDCSTIASGDNFLQVQIKDQRDTTAGRGAGYDTAETFVLTMIKEGEADTDPNAFIDQSYIKISFNNGGNNQADQGIAHRQVISSTEARAGLSPETFLSGSEINTGWAVGKTVTTDANGNVTGEVLNPDLLTNVAIVQELTAPGSDTLNDDFESNFYYEAITEAPSTVTNPGFKLDITQVTGLQQTGSGGQATDNQVFALAERSGSSFSTASHTAGTGGIDLAWNAGDDIKGIWLGQQVDVRDTGAVNAVNTYFGYASFTNNTTAPSDPFFSSDFGQSNAASAWLWDTATFGSAPCMADPSGGPTC